MDYEIPLLERHEHEALHDRLRQATQAGDEIGGFAKTLARLMHPHFVNEDQIALPPLGLPAALAHGDATPEMAGVLVLTDQLEPSYRRCWRNTQPSSKRYSGCTMRRRAKGAARSSTFEGELTYPAAILVGRFAPQRLGKPMQAAG